MNLVRRKLFPILKSYLFIFISYFLTTLLLTGCSADRNGSGYVSQNQTEPISVNGPKQLEYEIGYVAYWPEGNELLIYYKSDGKPMRSDIIVMGKIESGVEVFEKYSGNVNISFSMIDDSK